MRAATHLKAARVWLTGTRDAGRTLGAKDTVRIAGIWAGQVLLALDMTVPHMTEEAWSWLREQTQKGDLLHKRWALLVLNELVGRSDRPTVRCKQVFAEVANV